MFDYRLSASDGSVCATRVFEPCYPLYGVSARTGEVRWRTAVGAEVNGKPRLAGDVVLVGTGQGRLHALDPDTGALQWTAEAGRGFDATPVVVGTTVVAPSFDGIVHFLDLTDGGVRPRWGERSTRCRFLDRRGGAWIVSVPASVGSARSCTPGP